MNKLPTPNWTLLKHAGSGFAITVIITSIVGLGQALVAQGIGNINWTILGSLAAGTFLGALARLYPALIPQVEQAFNAPVLVPAASPVAVHVYPASGAAVPVAQVEQVPAPVAPVAPMQSAYIPQPPSVVPQQSFSNLADYRSQVTRFNESQIVPTVQPPRQ